jgi:Tfp pilus assembly protein PilN
VVVSAEEWRDRRRKARYITPHKSRQRFTGYADFAVQIPFEMGVLAIMRSRSSGSQEAEGAALLLGFGFISSARSDPYTDEQSVSFPR